MDVLISTLDLARFQFAQTTIFHFFFVPLSIGLALAVSIFETLYVFKKDQVYQKLAKFWASIFLLSFAVGVVTGIIQEFQFGMNWSEYSRYVGDIFGAPLAIEALVAFFAESTFIGLWSFTWERFKPGIHAIFIWLVTLSSMLSAFWILLANSFMQNPVGFEINTGAGRAQLTNFLALIKNPQLWHEFPHVIFGAIVMGGMVVLGSSAYRLIKERKGENLTFYRISARVGSYMAFVGVVGSLITGDAQTVFLESDQPMKYASIEGDVQDSGTPDGQSQQSWAVVAWVGKDKNGNPVDSGRIEVPYVQSLLAHHDLKGYNPGMLTLEKELEAQYPNALTNGVKNFYVPNNILFYSFRIMSVGAGAVLLLSLIAIFMNRKKSDLFVRYRWVLFVFAISAFLPFILNTTGWLITELGRAPWVVYGLLTIADAVSPNVSAASLLVTNVVYFATFLTLGGVMLYLTIRVLNKGPEVIETESVSSLFVTDTGKKVKVNQNGVKPLKPAKKSKAKSDKKGEK